MEVVSFSYSIKKLNPLSLEILLFILLILLLLSSIFIVKAWAHKLIESYYNSNTGFESALTILNHTISWALFQQLGGEDNVQARFYKFNNQEINSSFYAQITIPKIEKYLNFAPSLVLVGPKIKNNSNNSFIIQDNNIAINKSSNNSNNNNKLPFNILPNYQILIKSDYKGTTPSPIFYEPFTQTSYWERQEIKTKLQNIGVYYIMVINNTNDNNKISSINNNEGKFSLAVGEVEDFLLEDFFILLPYTWIKINLFFNNYLRIFIAVIIFVFIVILPIMIIYIRKRRKKIVL